MKKTIIAVWGAASKGKSSTIRGVYNLLKGDNRDEGEITEIVSYKKVKIGIVSLSEFDPSTNIEEQLKKFEEEECTIIICATRTRGQTVRGVELSPGNGYRIIWVTPTITDESYWEMANKKSAEYVVGLIDSVISGEL